MTASMIMYARPELDAAHARLWSCLHARLTAQGIKAPKNLRQTGSEFELWEDPELVFSQTCGMPYRTRLHGKVQLLATPDYGLEGCPQGYYRSAIIIRADDARKALDQFASARLAYNMGHSQSGFASIYAHVAPMGFWFQNRVESGGHLNSARMVADGRADIAAVDAQTWRLIQRYEAVSGQLRVLEWTAPTPALPFITGAAQNAAAVRACLRLALEDMPAADLATLDIKGIVEIPHRDYMAVPTPPPEAWH